jgi:hypothetical protein
MADDEQSTSGMVSGLVQDFIAQLRAVTEGLETWPDPVHAVRWHPARSRCVAPFRRRS